MATRRSQRAFSSRNDCCNNATAVQRYEQDPTQYKWCQLLPTAAATVKMLLPLLPFVSHEAVAIKQACSCLFIVPCHLLFLAPQGLSPPETAATALRCCQQDPTPTPQISVVTAVVNRHCHCKVMRLLLLPPLSLLCGRDVVVIRVVDSRAATGRQSDAHCHRFPSAQTPVDCLIC